LTRTVVQVFYSLGGESQFLQELGRDHGPRAENATFRGRYLKRARFSRGSLINHPD
jgi:hypothetical protein